MATGKFTVMRWLNDYNRLSVHNTVHITEPCHDSVKIGTTGIAKYPGFPGLWQFRVLNMGGKEEMKTWLNNNFDSLTEDVTDAFLEVDTLTQPAQKTVSGEKKEKIENDETPDVDKKTLDTLTQPAQKTVSGEKRKREKMENDETPGVDKKTLNTLTRPAQKTVSGEKIENEEIPSVDKKTLDTLTRPALKTVSRERIENEETPSVDEKTSSENEDRYLKSEAPPDRTKSSCEKRLRKLEEEVSELKSDVKRLKKKLKMYEQGQGQKGTTSENSASMTTVSPAVQKKEPTAVTEQSQICQSDVTVSEIKSIVEHLSGCTEKEVNEIIRSCTFKVFSKKDIINCSRTGKKTIKSGETPRPALDLAKVKLLEQAVLEKCTNVTREIFIKKFENLQKMERRRSSCELPK